MSIIPNSAIAAALMPVERSTHETGRALKVQADKNNHHAEDVEELDETAVNSVHDQGGGGRQKDPNTKKRREGEPEEKVEIAALSGNLPVVPLVKSEEGGISHLDISA